MTSLSATERARYSRHTLLPEIGVAGQEQLCRAVIQLRPDADDEARTVARDYLERAGVTVIERTDTTMAVADARTIDQSATPSLRHAAAALAGAFAAVEAIKSITGAGQPAEFPAHLTLFLEEL